MAGNGGYRPGSGRKKGMASIYAEEFRDMAAKAVIDNAPVILKALLVKAKTADIAAIKELFDRAFGRAPQFIESNTIADGLSQFIAFSAAAAANSRRDDPIEVGSPPLCPGDVAVKALLDRGEVCEGSACKQPASGNTGSGEGSESREST